MAVGRSQAAVTLLDFTGYGEDGSVNLEWETATEIDTSGFYVRRSTTENGTFTRIPVASPEFIDATGDSLVGDYYFFIDEDVVNDTGYWYQLEVMDTNSQSTLIKPPIQVIAGVYATDTPGQTGTPTSTATVPSGSNQTSSVTPTRTPIWTRTPTPPTDSYPGPATATSAFRFFTQTPVGTAIAPLVTQAAGAPSASAGLSLTESITATATLIPLPEITLQFPTPVEALGSDSLKSGLTRQESETGGKQAAWFTLERLVFLGFILLIWVILGGWFYLSYRRLE